MMHILDAVIETILSREAAMTHEQLKTKLEDFRRRQPREGTEVGIGAVWILEMCELMLEISEHTLSPDRPWKPK